MVAPSHPSRFDHAALARGVLARKPILAAKLEAACGVTGPDVEALLIEVLRFVNLAAHARAQLGTSLTPSVMIDDAWHELILCTREYRDLCTQQFGRFVDHDPGGDDELNRSRFRATLQLYALSFGNPDPRWWGPAATAMTHLADADCGACHTPT